MTATHLTVVAALAAAGLAGCSTTSMPPADRVVYEVRPAEGVPAERVVVVERTVTVAPGPRRSVQDELDDEAARRLWIESNYGPPRTEVRYEERYVPPQQEPPVRVVEVERDWRQWIPPITLGVGYWSGGHHGHHEDNWGWGLNWAVPLW